MSKTFVDTWICNECEVINVSDSSITHNMTMCECGKSGYDLEEEYSRTLGNILVVSRIEYNEDKSQVIKVINYVSSLLTKKQDK